MPSMVLWPVACGLGGSAAAPRAAGDKRQETGDHIFGSRHVVLRLALSWIHRIFDLCLSPCMAMAAHQMGESRLEPEATNQWPANAAPAKECSQCQHFSHAASRFSARTGGEKGQWRSMSGASTNVSFKSMHMTFFNFVNASLDLAIGGERKQTPRCPSVAPRAPPWKNGAPRAAPAERRRWISMPSPGRNRSKGADPSNHPRGSPIPILSARCWRACEDFLWRCPNHLSFGLFPSMRRLPVP